MKFGVVLKSINRRLRASDSSRDRVEVIPTVDSTSQAPQSSPAADRTTIKLVQPSPPQTAASMVVPRSGSAESQPGETTMVKPTTSSSPILENDQRNLHTTTSKKDTLDHTPSKRSLPIYEQFTPSRQQQIDGTVTSPTLGPSTTFLSRASSPQGDDASHLPPHLRSSGSVGKSGRVIEKITSENSRLHRELNEKTARLEEAQRTHETDKIVAQEAKESAMRHQHMYETNEAILIRRDRKVEELKESLSSEKIRRELAERERQEMTQALHTERSNTSKQLALEREKRVHYQKQYEILEQSYKKGRMPWQPQVDQLRQETTKVGALLHGMATNQDNIIAQRSKLDELHAEYLAKVEEYKEAKKDVLGPLAEKIEKNEAAADDLLKDMEATLHKMKWVMAVKKNVAGC